MDTTATATAPTKPDEFVASGGSPPHAGLPAHLVDQLADILAEALIVDLQQFPNLEATRPLAASTANSPRGSDRNNSLEGGAGAVEDSARDRRRQRQP
jgi:hypothetical protein